jgi:hypothetical protein
LLFRCCSLLFTVLNNCSRTRTTAHRSTHTHTLLSTPLLHFFAEQVETVVHVLFMCSHYIRRTPRSAAPKCSNAFALPHN